jgi:hypothetical protein
LLCAAAWRRAVVLDRRADAHRYATACPDSDPVPDSNAIPSDNNPGSTLRPGSFSRGIRYVDGDADGLLGASLTADLTATAMTVAVSD